MRIAGLALLLLCPHLATAQVIAIEHANVLPMDGERVLRDQTLIIRGAVITELGPSARIAVPAQATRIDARNKFVMPGLVDAHVHLYDTEGFASYLAYGVTSVMNLHGGPSVLAWRAAQRAGRLDGPTVYSAGPTINGYPPGNPMFVSVVTPADAIAEVRAQKAAGYDVIKAYSFLDSAVFAALVGEARRLGVPVVGHIPLQVGREATLRSGVSNIAHVEEFFQAGDIPNDSMAAVARRVREAGVSVTANIFAYSDYLRKIRDFPAVMADPEMQFASPAQFSEKIRTSNRALNRSNLEQFAAFLQQRRERFRLFTKTLADAGVPILLGTDTEIFGFPGQSAYLELLELRDAGLTPYQALAAATRNAGDLLVQSGDSASRERTGRIANGYRADLLVLERNPLADVRDVRSIVGVMTRGRWYPSARITEMRDSVARRNEPRRSVVAGFDITFIQSGDGAGAARMLDRFRVDDPSALLLAEGVWRGYGRLRSAQDPAPALAIRRAFVDAYPQSFMAWNELALSFLVARDTAGALNALERSLALNPRNFPVRDMHAKVTTRRAGSGPDAAGSYAFGGFVSAGKTYEPTVVVTPMGSGYTGTIAFGGSAPQALSELVVGIDRIWATTSVDGRNLELRFDRRTLEGTWVHGFMSNGVLRRR